MEFNKCMRLLLAVYGNTPEEIRVRTGKSRQWVHGLLSGKRDGIRITKARELCAAMGWQFSALLRVYAMETATVEDVKRIIEEEARADWLVKLINESCGK